MDRKPIDEYFMDIAKLVATRSTCVRRQVGSVIVKDKHIISTGYNGSPKGLPHCIDVGCLRDKLNIPSGTKLDECMANHSEANAIIQAGLHGASTFGATLYCTHQPCSICAKMIINAGIVQVVFNEGYPDERTKSLFHQAGVKL